MDTAKTKPIQSGVVEYCNSMYREAPKTKDSITVVLYQLIICVFNRFRASHKSVS